jgi:hypothetical protein
VTQQTIRRITIAGIIKISSVIHELEIIEQVSERHANADIKNSVFKKYRAVFFISKCKA